MDLQIYKAPQRGKAQKLLEVGFHPEDFPYIPPYLDGKCYFAGPNDRSIAEEFNQIYQAGRCHRGLRHQEVIYGSKRIGWI